MAAALVHALQSQWTPVLADVSRALPSLRGQFDAAWWAGLPGYGPPVYYVGVLASGVQVVGSVARCDVASQPEQTGADAAVAIAALDALTPPQLAALSPEQFASDVLGEISANRGASVSVFGHPGTVTVGDSMVSLMTECETRTYGTGRPETGDVTILSGRIDSVLLDVVSSDEQIVSKNVALSSALSDGRSLGVNGTFYVYFSRGLAASVVKDDIRVLDTTALVAPLAPQDPAVHSAQLLVPMPGVAVGGSSAAPTLQVEYEDWQLNLDTGVAVSGAVIVTDGKTSAVIRPSGDRYNVVFGTGSQAKSYSVAPT